MRRCLAVVCLAVVLLLPAVARGEVDEYLGKPVLSVALEIDGRAVRDPRLLDLIESRTGAPLVMASVRESIIHLFSLGRFEDVRVRAAARINGVSLTFELRTFHPVTTLAFSGGAAAAIDEGRMRRVLAERFGPAPRPSRAADMAGLVEDELKRTGYLRAAVTPRVETDRDSGRVTLRFEIVPGTRARIGAIDVQGDAGMPPSEMLGLLGVSAGAPFRRDLIDARIDRYLEGRRRQGFFAARLSASPRAREGDATVDVTFAVSQGPRVRVLFKGDPLPSDRRDDLVPVARDGLIDEDLLEDSSLRIEDYLRAQGYRDATAPFTREETGGELHVTFTVTRGQAYRVARVEIAGNTSVPQAELEPRLRVRAGQPFSVAAVNADLAAIEDGYRRNGYAAVRAQMTTDLQPAAGATEVPVVVHIAITENVRTLVTDVRIDGSQSVPDADLRRGLGLQPGTPFFLTQLAIDRDAIQLRYANLGYQSATVTSNPGINPEGTSARVAFTVREGPRVFVDHVLIVGNERTRTTTIERELQFKSGDPLGLESVNESQRRLAGLGLFRRTRITELGNRDDTRRDVLVTVEEAPVTSIGYGGGFEAAQRLRTDQGTGLASDRLEFAPRAFFEVGRRNLFGKNRSVNLFTRVSLRPQADASTGRGFSEYRVIGTFREPRALGTGADAVLTATLEQQRRSTFNFARRAFNTELGRRLTPHVSISGNYQIQRTELFDEQIDPSFTLLIDRVFPQIRLSSFSASAVRDTRDDPTDPLAGHFLTANVQIAARHVGSEIGLAKTYFTAQAFRTLPRAGRAVLAASARLGMGALFPRLIPALDENGDQERDAAGTPIMVRDVPLPASERFFAGGDTTVRGFALDQLGTPSTKFNRVPNGGNGLVILNVELRLPVRGGLGVVGFVDAGNVFYTASDIDLGQLRGAAGFGVRYRSPIGPIRVDVGFKTHRETTLGVRESASALHISLGQAF